MTTVADWHTRALDATGRMVAAIPVDRWQAATPCPEWDVRGLVSHSQRRVRRRQADPARCK